MTLIQIKPHRWGWKVFEDPGVEPVLPEKDHAIDYAQGRACFRFGEDVARFEARPARILLSSNSSCASGAKSVTLRSLIHNCGDGISSHSKK
jgi:hypothetical protein